MQIVTIKSAGLDILIPDQTDFKPKTVTRNKEEHFTMIKSQTIRKIYHKRMHLTVEP